MLKTRADATRLAAASLAILPLLGVQAHAYEKTMACMLVVEADSGKVLTKEGAGCATRVSPASTFKVPLAVMGFESGILKDGHDPIWPYKKEYKAELEFWRHDTDATRWEEKSVVWFSRELTKKLGMKDFQKFTDSFDYGNRDLSGDKGKNNGLTQSWISSSLEISPEEQVAFLRKLLARQLPVSAQAAEKTMSILPIEKLDNGWTVHGKTGSSVERDAQGKIDRSRQFGWYVGWAEKDGKQVVFARLNRNAERQKGGMGVPTKNETWDALEHLLK